MALERLELLITSVGGAAVKDIKAVEAATGEAAAAQTLLQKTSNTTRAALDQVGLGAVSTGTAFKGAALAGGALAAVGIAKFALDSVNAFSSATAEVRAYQRVTGATAEDSSRLAVAVRLSGVEATSAENGFFQLGKRIGQNKDTLDEHGAAVQRNADGTVNMSATLLSAADAFQKIKDPAERDAFVMENFGRGGKDLIPILSKSREELQKFFASAAEHHEIFTQDDLNKGREFKLAMTELSDTFLGFKLAVGQAVIPTVTQFATTASSTLTSLDNLAAGVGGVGNVLEKANNFAPWTNAMHTASSAAELLQGNFGAAAGEFARSIPVVGGLVGLFDDGAGATDKFADAQSKGKDAVATMNRLAAEGKTNTAEYAQAQRDAQAAGDVLTGTNQKVADSLQSVSDKAALATQNLLAQANASIALEGGSLAVKDAQDKLTEAQKLSSDAAQFGIDKSRDVEKAQLAVESAVTANVVQAGNYAVALLGPTASAQDQNAARSEAQRKAFEALGGQLDDTTYNRLAPYLTGLGAIPPRVSTDIGLNGIDYVLEQLRIYKEKLDGVVGPYVADVIVQSHGTFDPIPGIVGIQPIFGDALIQAWPEAAEKLIWSKLRPTPPRKEPTDG